MAVHECNPTAIFGEGFERCPVTGRPYEVGSGCLSKEVQTANYIREAGLAAEMPKRGQVCQQTGRPFQTGSGALPKKMQTARFLSELPSEQQAQRTAAALALRDVEPAGRG